MTPPATDPKRPESPSEHKLWLCVPALDPSHDPTAFLRTEYVRHLASLRPVRRIYGTRGASNTCLRKRRSSSAHDTDASASQTRLCLTASVSAPPFARALLGWRAPSRTGVSMPNTSDAASRQSVTIASHILALLDVPETSVAPDNPATPFEEGVRAYLEESLPVELAGRQWVIDRDRRVIDFAQYAHLARVQEIIDRDVTRTLAAELGRDYVIKPDVTVGIQTPDVLMLHASVSCKWTIRSDRVQNIRHEAVILTRHRRGRQPHIVAVTAEPLPTRLASIARGTGEIDAVYHVAFEELSEAVHTVGTVEQKATLSELSGQGRLYDFNVLPDVLQF